MNGLAFIVSVVALAACGRIGSESGVRAVGSAERDSVVFERDLRMVDGALVRITVKKDDSGKYDVVKNVAGFDRRTGKSFDEKTDLILGGSCRFEDDGRTLKKIDCARDLRPVDGNFVRVLIERKEKFGYTAQQFIKGWNRITNKEFNETKTIGSNLKLR